MKKNIPLLDKISLEGKELDYTHILSDCPNPKLQRMNVLSLNGLYRMEESKNILIPVGFKKSATLPFVVGSTLSEVKLSKNKKAFYHFQKAFQIEEGYLDSYTYLNVTRIEGKYAIYLNGKKVSEGENAFRLKVDISYLITTGSNTIVFSITKSKINPFIGVSGHIYLESTGENTINKVDVSVDRLIGEVTFKIDQKENGGVVTIYSPNSTSSSKEFKLKEVKMSLLENVYYKNKMPFFYTYEIDNGTDKVKGNFIVRDLSFESKEGINYLSWNDEPFFIKAIKDDYYYSDTFITYPSIDQVSRIFTEIMHLGYNSILLNRIELPGYYYNAEIKGLSIIQRLEFESMEKTLKYIDYLCEYNSVIMINVIFNKGKIYKERLRKILKNKYPNKIFILGSDKDNKDKDFRFLKSIHNFSSIGNKKYSFIESFGDREKTLYNLNKFNESLYKKARLHGLVGYSILSINNKMDGIFSVDKTNKLIDFNELSNELK